jgi:hypothetical protein
MSVIITNATELKVSHPGPTPDEYKLKEEQFSYNSGFKALSHVDKYLTSFAKLTELIETKTQFRQRLPQRYSGESIKDNISYSLSITLKELNSVENLEWDVQTLGFHNHYITIKGTLLLQQAKIKELEYELLKLKKSNEITLKNAQKEATESRRLFNEYTGNQSWVD